MTVNTHMNVAQAGRIGYNTRAVYVVYVCTVNRIDTVHCIACCVHGVFVHSHGVTAGLHTGIVWGCMCVCIEREVELTEG